MKNSVIEQRQFLYVGDRISMPYAVNMAGIFVGAKFRKVDKDYCGHERPWTTFGDKLCPEGQVVEIVHIARDFFDPTQIVISLKHFSSDGRDVATVSKGWLSWFAHCFFPYDELEIESVEALQIAGV